MPFVSDESLKERNARIWELRRRNWTLQQIGDYFGFTRERARQIIEQESRVRGPTHVRRARAR